MDPNVNENGFTDESTPAGPESPEVENNNGAGDAPEWQKKFESPEAMWDSYRSLQAEYTRLRQGINEKSVPGVPEEDIPEEPVSPDDIIESVLEQRLDEKVGDIVEYVNQQRVAEVMRQVNEVFPDFDFEKEGDALAEELKSYDAEFKRKHPVEAALKAVASLRGVRASSGNSGIYDRLQNFSEGVSNRKPPKPVDEVEDIIAAKQSSLPW